MKTNCKIKVIVVAGARPNFMKCAPILKELKKTKSFQTIFVHTGQHYDYDMSKVFFEHLKLREPDIFLGVGSAPRTKQIASIKNRFEKVAKRFQPDVVIVVGDVNSTLGAAIAAKKIGAKIAHIEAGLRSFDKSMPEEMNRIATDAISDFLFTTSKSANANLIKEGISKEKIYFVGNIMIDTLVNNLNLAERSNVLAKFGLHKKKYYVLTLHRPSNVDNKSILKGILSVLERIAGEYRIVFPVHPRTKKALKKFRLLKWLKNNPVFIFTKPLGYLDFIKLVRHSHMVFTDSGGIQEETAYLKVPCLTLRANTERPITIEAGNNVIAWNTPDKILKASNLMSKLRRKKKFRPIKFWDGKTSNRIIKVLLKR